MFFYLIEDRWQCAPEVLELPRTRRALFVEGRIPNGREAVLTADQHTLLSIVLDHTHDCVKLLDAEGRIEFVNRQGAIVMELREPAELVGRPWLDRWPEESRPKIAEALAKAKAGQHTRFSAARPRPDGRPSWWDVTVSPIVSGTGELTHYLTIARDTTNEIVEHERVEAVGAEMRHRLKNALTIAGALVNMLARARDNPDVSDFADAICARFAQLARVQALVLDPETKKDFRDIVPMLAKAYGDVSLLQFGDIPDVSLGNNALQAVALAFGELCTNSLKYGALEAGRPIRVEGSLANDTLLLVWREETRFGPARKGGQGLDLIDRIVRASGGHIERRIEADRLEVRIALPATAKREQDSAAR